MPLSFAEEHEQYDIRRDESTTHRLLVADITTYLLRLGYLVYPGDVGLRGVFAWADLLALDGSEPLFVECLTKNAVDKYRRHEDKRPLAELAPFCFVGAVPGDFLASLPSTAYGIANPRSPRMIGGEWVPHFYRRGPFQPTFRSRSRPGRVSEKLEIVLDGLRREEDVGTFLWAAIGETIYDDAKHRAAVASGWTLKWPATDRGAPFELHGKPNSTLRLRADGSDLLVHVGRVPVVAELRGSSAALELMVSWLRDAGFEWDGARATSP